MDFKTCTICGAPAPFQAQSKRGGVDKIEWFCIDHTPEIWSPPEMELVAAKQIADRARAVAKFILRNGRKPLVTDNIISQCPTLDDLGKIELLEPALREQVEKLEKIAESIDTQLQRAS